MSGPRVIAYGGGIQSTSMLVLAKRKVIDYTDLLFANVGDDSEHPGTLSYVTHIAIPYAAHFGLTIHELGRYRRTGERETLLGRLVKPGSRSLPIPVRMPDTGAPGTRSCTTDFKILVLGKWLKAHGASPESPATVAVGISLDEIHRINARKAKPYEILDYPLVGICAGKTPSLDGLRLRRGDCEQVILDEPLPPFLAASLRGLIDTKAPDIRTGQMEYLFAKVTRADLLASDFTRMPRPPKSACYFCLAGETEVVTRQGVQQIADLAGTHADLLVPTVGSRGGLGETGTWQTVEVREFGVQPLRQVTLRRGRSAKVVHATGEHRWALKAGSVWVPAQTLVRTTDELRPGDRLKTLRATPLARERMSPFGVAHGFVYGDGTRPQGARGATLALYDNGKDDALLPFFAVAEPKLQEDGSHHVYGLPRAWKQLPDLAEHRGYLLGWLAGYFAADGHVSKAGQAVLYSASEASIRGARDICALLGIGYSPIRPRQRQATLNGRTYDSPLYALTLDAATVPAEFFVLHHHRDRAVNSPADTRERAWTVEAVTPTSRVETVYCAVVPGAEAFALADELLTGNCPFHRPSEWVRQRTEEPQLFAAAVDLENLLNARRDELGRDHVYLTRFGKPLAEAVPVSAPPDSYDDLDDPSCDNGWCMT